ncbi:MAG: hypothetical protein KJ638_13230 [Chloroflexi bacterium]|nr:hypothetical protein [Chloroflexota bacterium]
MLERGIFGEESFYVSAGFWRGVVSAVFLVSFFCAFWPKVRTVPQFVGSLRGRLRDTSGVESQQAETPSQDEAPSNGKSLAKTPFAKEIMEIFFRNDLQNTIREKQLDEITAPRQADADPRADILEAYQTLGFRARFKNVGAQLLWCGIGHFEIEDAIIADQRVSTWQAGWKGEAEVVRVDSEAIKEAYREQGRADAQVETLRAISDVLQDLNVAGDDRESVQKIFLFRLAQLLDAMGKDIQEQLPGGGS